MIKENKPVVTTPARYATWDWRDPKRQLGDNTQHYIQASHGQIRIHSGRDEIVITRDMVEWFADSVEQAANWIKDEKQP